MKFDLPKLGIALMGAGPGLMQLGGSKLTWWIGLAFSCAGPFLLACKRK